MRCESLSASTNETVLFLRRFCHAIGNPPLLRRGIKMVQVHSVPHSLYGGKPANLSKIGRNVHGYTERCSCRWGARSSRPLPSASRRRAGSNRLGAPNGEWNLLHELFGETPNR